MHKKNIKSPLDGQPQASFAEQYISNQGDAPRSGSTPDGRLSTAITSPRSSAAALNEKPSHAAIGFLKSFDPGGRHNLVAIDPGGKIPLKGRTFGPGAWDEMADWIDEREGRLNLYFSVNEPADDAPDDKLKKTEIGAIRAVHVDVDPIDLQDPDLAACQSHSKSERLRLRSLVEDLSVGPVPPSLAVDSGNGVHIYWLLSKKLDAKSWQNKVEACNRGAAKDLKGDLPTRDISRILRLPGTTNIPDPSKRAKGRIERRASVISSCEAKYTFEQIAARYEPVFEVERADNSSEVDRLIKEIDLATISEAGTFEALPAEMLCKFEKARAADPALDVLWVSGTPHGKDKTASSARFELARYLKSSGFSVDEFGALLWVWGHATSDGKERIEEYEDYDLRREIARCWAKVPRNADPHFWFEDLGHEPDRPRDRSSKKQLPGELISFQDLAASDLGTRTDPLIKGVLGQGAFSVLYGESNTGKTFVAMDMAFHISCGIRWAGMKTVQVPVLFVAAEGNQGATLRVKALQRKFSQEAAGAQFHLLLSSIDLLNQNEHVEPVVIAIRELGAKFVVLDTLSRVLAGGDENSSIDMGALVRNIDAIRKATGAHIMAVHHTGKNRERGARGHSLLRAAIDTEIEIADNSIAVTKQRDMDKSFNGSFLLETVELGKDEDGDPITSCTIRLVSENELPPGAVTETERKILEAMADLEEERGRKGLKPEDIADFLSDDEGPVSKEAVRTRLRELFKKRVVERAGRGIWRLKAVEMPSTVLDEGEEIVGHIASTAVENGQAGRHGVFG